MAESTHDHPAESILVVEECEVQQIQAQLTRLQLALGLRDSLPSEDLEKLAYGTEFKPLKIAGLTGFDTKDDTTIVSLNTRSKVVGDRLVEFAWAARCLDIATLRGVSLRRYAEMIQESRAFGASHQSPICFSDGIHEDTLAATRRAINNVFEPLCHGVDGNRIERVDGQSYDHTEHKTCTPRNQIILLLPDKEKCLHDLENLGCNPRKSPHLIEVVDMREIFQAYLVRKDYSYRSPMTGSHRTVLRHDWKDLSIASQIISVLNVTTAGDNDEGVLQNLQATVGMARKDMISRWWLRTREQVNGGDYPGPLVQLRTRRQVEAFLIDYDVTRGQNHSETNFSAQMEALKESMRLFTPSLYDGFIVNLARFHNYTQLLDRFAAPKDPMASSTTTIPTPSKSTPTEPVQESADECSTQPSVGTTGTGAQCLPASKSTPAEPVQKITDECSTPASVGDTGSRAQRLPASESTSTKSDEKSADQCSDQPPTQRGRASTLAASMHSDANSTQKLANQHSTPEPNRPNRSRAQSSTPSTPVKPTLISNLQTPPSSVPPSPPYQPRERHCGDSSARSRSTPAGSHSESRSSSPYKASVDRLPRHVSSQRAQYKLDQKALVDLLWNYKDSVNGTQEFRGLFVWKDEAKPIPLSNYPRVFEMVSRIPEFRVGPEMVRTLWDTIQNREKVQRTTGTCLFTTRRRMTAIRT